MGFKAGSDICFLAQKNMGLTGVGIYLLYSEAHIL